MVLEEKKVLITQGARAEGGPKEPEDELIIPKDPNDVKLVILGSITNMASN